jgi:putative transcriptional regulator
MKKRPYMKLKALRVENSLTQQDMADLLSINKATYNRKELGVTDFTLIEAFKIAKKFNTSIPEIFFTKKVNTNKTM